MTHIKIKDIGNIYFKYIVLFLFSVHLLFAKDEQGRVLNEITLNLELERFTIILLISMLIFLIVKSFSKLKLDLVSVLLIFRVVLSLFSLINYEGTLIEFIEAGYFQLVFLSVLYILIININDKNIESKIVSNLKFLTSILLMQIYYVFINAISKGVSINAVKSWITVPMGRSNFIAMMVAFLLMFFLIYMEKSFRKIIVLILLFGALLITLSDGALLSIILILSIYYLDKIGNRYVKYISILLIFILMILTFILPIEIIPNISTTNITIQDRINNILAGNFKAASSGRIDIYLEYLKSILEKPFYGNGFYKPFVKIQGTAHNFILQEAYNAGLPSLYILISALVILMKKIRRYINRDGFIKATYYSAGYVIIHSLIEPGILGYKIGFYFWLVIAASILKIRLIKENHYNVCDYNS